MLPRLLDALDRRPVRFWQAVSAIAAVALVLIGGANVIVLLRGSSVRLDVPPTESIHSTPFPVRGTVTPPAPGTAPMPAPAPTAAIWVRTALANPDQDLSWDDGISGKNGDRIQLAFQIHDHSDITAKSMSMTIEYGGVADNSLPLTVRVRAANAAETSATAVVVLTDLTHVRLEYVQDSFKWVMDTPDGPQRQLVPADFATRMNTGIPLGDFAPCGWDKCTIQADLVFKLVPAD